MWPCTPLTVRCPVQEPRRPIFAISPRRLGLVGSPTRQASNFSPSAASACSIGLVPLTEGPSSSPVMRSEIAPAKIAAGLGDEARGRRGKGRDRAFHVGGAAAIEPAIDDLRRERIDAPALAPADRHHVAMAGEAEMLAWPLAGELGVEVVDPRRPRRLERHAPAGEANGLQRARERIQRARIRRRHARAADQRLRERDGIDRCLHVGLSRAAAR